MTTRTVPRPPPFFAEEFAIGGWERVEFLYRARTDTIRKWIIMTGAQCRRPKKRMAA